MNREGGYIGILALLISVCLLVFLYLKFTPLALVTPETSGQGTTTEAQLDIQAAAQAKAALEARSREETQMLQQ